MVIYYVWNGWLFAATHSQSSTQGRGSLVFMFEPFAAMSAHQSHINLPFRVFRVCIGGCFETLWARHSYRVCLYNPVHENFTDPHNKRSVLPTSFISHQCRLQYGNLVCIYRHVKIYLSNSLFL